MSATSVRVASMAALLLIIGGIATMLWTASARRADDRLLLDATFVSMARVRELDRILVIIDRGDARRQEAAASVDEWMKTAPGLEELEVAKRLYACLTGTDCEGGTTAAVQTAKEFVESRFEKQWKQTDERAISSRHMTYGALVVVALGVLLAAMLLVRLSRSSATAGTEASTDQMKQLLQQRSEQLYSAQLKAWETERFAAYGEIVAGLSHGLKTPLAGIRAAAQLAQAKLDAEHPAHAQLIDIIGQTDGLVEQIRRLLQATDSSSPVPARVDLDRVVKTLNDEYASTAIERGLKWKIDTTDGLGSVLVDSGSLIMALRNLVENAFAAAPEGSTVAVVTRACDPPDRVGISDQPPGPGDWIEIVVSDEGPGLPEDVAAGHGVESEKPDGSGLGLAIARRIVARYGGALICESGDAGGAVIRVALPVATPEGGAEAAT